MQGIEKLRNGLSAEAQIELALVAAQLAFPFWQRAFPEREHQVALIAALDAVKFFCSARQLAPNAKAVAELAYQSVSACDLPAGDIQRSSGFSVAHVAMAPWLLSMGSESKAKHNVMVAINYSEAIHKWAGRLLELEAALTAQAELKR
jgi:hypothetical protein